MIKYVRVDAVQVGRWSEAHEAAKKMAKHINQNCPPAKPIELLTSISGTGNKVTWMADFQDMGAWEKWWMAFGGHEGTKELMAIWPDFFVSGNQNVQFYRISDTQ